jgi:hypothetical protein
VRPKRQEQHPADQVHGPLVDMRSGVPPAKHGGPGADRVADDATRGDAWIF